GPEGARVVKRVAAACGRDQLVHERAGAGGARRVHRDEVEDGRRAGARGVEPLAYIVERGAERRGEAVGARVEAEQPPDLAGQALRVRDALRVGGVDGDAELVEPLDQRAGLRVAPGDDEVGPERGEPLDAGR